MRTNFFRSGYNRRLVKLAGLGEMTLEQLYFSDGGGLPIFTGDGFGADQLFNALCQLQSCLLFVQEQAFGRSVNSGIGVLARCFKGLAVQIARLQKVTPVFCDVVSVHPSTCVNAQSLRIDLTRCVYFAKNSLCCAPISLSRK